MKKNGRSPLEYFGFLSPSLPPPVSYPPDRSLMTTGPLVQRHARHIVRVDPVSKRAISFQADHGMTVALAGPVDQGHEHVLHATGIQAVEHVHDQRLVVHGWLPATSAGRCACKSVASSASKACAKACNFARACSGPLPATGDDTAQTEDRGAFPRSTSHACSNLVITAEDVQRRSTQYQYHTNRGPVAPTSRSSPTLVRRAPATSTCRLALLKICESAES